MTEKNQASEAVTRDIAYNGGARGVVTAELFSINAGIPTGEAERFATYLLDFVQQRMFELGDTRPLDEEFTVHAFLLETVSAIRLASRSEAPRALAAA